MPETEHTQENISYIRTHVDKLEQMTRFSIAANPNCVAFVEEHLKAKKGAPDVYLALGDGAKNQDELTEITKQSQANVSKICTHLLRQGLITRVADPDNARSSKYRWTELENILRVSKIAKRLV